MPSYLSPGVYVEEVESGSRPIEGVGTSVAAFIGFARKGPFDEPTLITNWSQFTARFGDFVEGTYLAAAVYGFFSNGGGTCYVVRVDDGTAPPDGAGAEPEAGAGAGAGLPAAAEPTAIGAYSVVARPGVTGTITVEIADAEGDDPPTDAFRVIVRRDGEQVEEYASVTTKRSKENVATRVNASSALIEITEPGTGAAPARPEPQTVTLAAAAPAPGGSGTPALGPEVYVGNADRRSGIGGLEAVEEITTVAVPDLMSAYERGLLDLDGVIAVQQALITHCELMGDRVAVLDPPPGLSPQEVGDWRTDRAGYDSKYAALYYPWIRVADPSSTSRITLVPPSGHIAGIWARNDDQRGVHKAPANEVVRGAVALATQLTKGEHDRLNPAGVNCIRAFPGRGIRVWGARTLASDPAWRYLNVRRLFNYLEESILAGTQWVVFEPNDDALWARIRRTVAAFLVNEWRRGALFGLTPDEAFYVKCDRETNPPESVDGGQVICEIGVAPVRPAEFVVFRLSQLTSGTGAVDE
ncbi:phage tail sheath subtilisin-like domain-containing protein [Streptomyces sp. NPDC046203]|uniref:phage tail sheath family protein n=1 Tax=Streptomyces sp. NPDC046203 TaxID=3154602 RepID=UPI0033F0E393